MQIEIRSRGFRSHEHLGARKSLKRVRFAAAVAASATIAALTVAPSALAQSYDLVTADVRAQVQADGSVAVEEGITVSFGGGFQFTYGFREIPYRRGEEISGIVVRQSYPESPPRVEYALTPKGEALLPVVHEMRRFGHEWLGCGVHGS